MQWKISPHFLAYLLIFRNTDQQGRVRLLKLQNGLKSVLKGLYFCFCVFVCLCGHLNRKNESVSLLGLTADAMVLDDHDILKKQQSLSRLVEMFL